MIYEGLRAPTQGNLRVKIGVGETPPYLGCSTLHIAQGLIESSKVKGAFPETFSNRSTVVPSYVGRGNNSEQTLLNMH